MADMRQYVCWTDTAVTAASPRDAASLKPGHFQAVHHPLKLWKRPLGTQSRGRQVEETEVVQVLEGPLRPDGYLLVPIVGGSGTGKSHLVRWVWNRTKDRDNWESRYLAKNRTSLRHVIETVIKDLNGPAVEAAREALLNAPAQSENERVLSERLLDELALITSEESSARINVDDLKTAQTVDKLRHELPDILRDPVVRRRLTADGAVIPRLVGLAMRGRRDGDGLDDDAIRVTDDDLPVTFTEISEASSGARNLLVQLGSIPTLMSAAVGLINEALPAAVKRVFISSQVNLIEIFREVRRELLGSSKELVLFIEDLTVLHGVEREFLDAIVEPARSPDGELCELRILFAVTDGHFDGLDTVRTRCDDAYYLDTRYDPEDPEDVDREEAMSFLGRYLNVCRQDPAQIDSAWVDRQSDAWVPNACDECDHQLHCHETFGRSEEGYGLYPYNPAAVNRFVTALSSERFDPREIVRELVNRFLIVATTDLERGDFPSDELVKSFNESSDPVDPVVQSELRSGRPSDYVRIVNSMRYWSEDSTVRDEILAAFGLDALGEREISRPPRSRSRGKSTSVKASNRSKRGRVDDGEMTLASQLRSPWSRIFGDLSTWASNQKDLSAIATSSLKKLVHRSILQNLDFNALPTNLGADFDDQKRFDDVKHIRIAGSVTDQHLGDPIIVIKQDAHSAAALQGLILLAELPDIDDYSDNYRRQAAQYLEEWTLCIVSRLEQSPELATFEAITGLLICAVVSGTCEDASDPHDYLANLFGAAYLADCTHRSLKWQDLVKMTDDNYRRLRPVVEAHFGEARGTGGSRAIRADQILTVIRDFTESWSFESSDSAIDRFMRSVRSTVEDEWKNLELLAGAELLVDLNRSWSEQSERMLELIETAHRLGRLRDYNAMSDLKALASSIDENAHVVLLSAAELVGSNPSFIERLRVVASNLPEIVKSISRFLTRAEQAMDGIVKDLDEQRTGRSEDESIEMITSDIQDELSRLEEAIEELGK